MKGFVLLVGLAVIVSSAAPAFAAPLTAELARMCREAAVKAYPSKPPGTRDGTEQAQRQAFRDCVTKNSKKDD